MKFWPIVFTISLAAYVLVMGVKAIINELVSFY